jgi:multiple sugar transport system ATP-binding protein
MIATGVMIAGLESISSGRRAHGGRMMNTVPAVDRDIAMVFQPYALFPHMSAADSLSLRPQAPRHSEA